MPEKGFYPRLEEFFTKLKLAIRGDRKLNRYIKEGDIYGIEFQIMANCILIMDPFVVEKILENNGIIATLNRLEQAKRYRKLLDEWFELKKEYFELITRTNKKGLIAVNRFACV